MTISDDIVDVTLYIIVFAFGLNYVVAYVFRWTMHIPGEVLKPDVKPFGRLFVMGLGLVMAIWAGYSLLQLTSQ